MPPTMNRRRLARGTPPESQARAVNCLACEWRKASHVGLKTLSEANPGLERYTGFLHGVQDSFLISAQFVNGRQVGLITIPLRDVEGFLDSVVQYLNAFVEAAEQASEQEVPDDPEEEDGDGEEEEASEED